ncbi:MAG: biotin--[acetyl-CoA-carboxylase] ligase [Bacteroidales bacterium]|nr:biotin--[acetyl-CoA-carboxylase] ligase [Bacteroidales bacterium]
MGLSFSIKTIENIASTSLLLRDWQNRGKLIHGDVLRAVNQTGGIGQAGNRWESEKNKNLTFSFYIEPRFLAASDVFMLNKIVALAVHDYLSEKQIAEVKIKWPNDIYVGHKKITGMLTHNSFLGDKLEYSIVGLGLNINQTEFKSEAPNPISLKLLRNTTFDLENELNLLLDCIKTRYSQLKNKLWYLPDADYLRHLYGINEQRNFSDREGIFTGRIKGIDNYGRLLVEKANKQLASYDIKEIEFL